MIVLVDNQSTDDPSEPDVGVGPDVGQGKNLAGGEQIFYPTIPSGAEATFTILYAVDGVHRPAGSITKTDNVPFKIDIPNSSDVNCYTTGISGGAVSLKTEH